MQARITLRNYRCFSEDRPAVFELGPGFTSFIGPNNAGKSTILRFFFELRHVLKPVLGLPNGSNIAGLFGTRAGLGTPPLPITDPTEIVYERARGPLQFSIEVARTEETPENFIQKAEWTNHDPHGSSWSVALYAADGSELRAGDPGRNVASIDQTYVHDTDGRRHDFRPIVKTVGALIDTQYLGPFRNAVNVGAGTYYDLELGTAFLAQWHFWKTGGNKQMNRAIGRVTEDVRRLIGARTLEINASTELGTLQFSIDGRPLKLSELGAGIAQLVLVLGNVLIRRPSFVAIDEPEIHLHPALQLDFLTTLASYASHGVIYATHSLGLARASSDRLYSVQAANNGSLLRPYDKTPDYAEFLGSLGIAGLQDIGWDRVLLVEGPHDVRTFQQLLRKFGRDRAVVILPMGGSSMIHGGTTHLLEEVLRLCPTVFAVIDSEKRSERESLSRERSDFAANCSKLGIKCLVTAKRATENYLTNESLRKAFGTEYVALGPFDAPSSAMRFWGKSENWRAAQELELQEIDKTDVGRFLAAI